MPIINFLCMFAHANSRLKGLSPPQSWFRHTARSVVVRRVPQSRRLASDGVGDSIRTAMRATITVGLKRDGLIKRWWGGIPVDLTKPAHSFMLKWPVVERILTESTSVWEGNEKEAKVTEGHITVWFIRTGSDYRQRKGLKRGWGGDRRLEKWRRWGCLRGRSRSEIEVGDVSKGRE